MAEIIFGLGSHSTLFDVITTALAEIEQVFGAPREIAASAPGIAIQVQRPGLSGEFESLVLRMPVDEKLREILQALVDDKSMPCALTESEGELEFRVQATEDPEGLQQVIAQLSPLLDLPEVWHVHGAGFRDDRISPYTLFKAMSKHHASDVHLVPGMPPSFRVDGSIRRSDNAPAVSSTQVLQFIRELAPAEQWREFEKEKQTSFKYHQAGIAYSRVSAFYRGNVAHCTLRFLSENIPSFEELHIPADTMESLATLHDGLILVTGMTGSGKSTTVAALVDWINSTRSAHILCVEDPAEYIHKNKKAIVSQREIGTDVESFTAAVRGALRQDPDVIFVGEMRDTDTIRSVINAAATGHLVISTLHSNSASDVVNRITSFFDPTERDLVRLQLHDCLRCVMCQRLLPRNGGGRLPALEFMFNDMNHISHCILTGDSDGLRLGMQQSFSASITFEESLLNLVKSGLIDPNTAHHFAPHPETFEQMRLGTYVAPSLDSMGHH
jgi:twitching motility protein PilT